MIKGGKNGGLSRRPDSTNYVPGVRTMANANFRFCFRNIKSLKKLKDSRVRFKSFNSNEWLKRRDMDPYVEKAKRENYRCRSAYKLIEIDDKYKLLKPGLKVLDVGAAPGSWSQVLAARTNSNGHDLSSPKGLVIAIDVCHIVDIDGVVNLPHMDFTEESSQNKILSILKTSKLDFVFSDMAPAATGVKNLDQEKILNLVYPVLVFSVKNLKLGGGCLIKIWEGQHAKMTEQMKRFFQMFNLVKPNATYTSSSETYLLGRGFVGLKK